MLKLVLIPPQSFGSEAKTRGGILGAPANKNLQNEYTVHIPEKKTQFVQTVGSQLPAAVRENGPAPSGNQAYSMGSQSSIWS